MASSSTAVSFPSVPADWDEHTSTVEINLWLASLAPRLAAAPLTVRLLPTVICYRHRPQRKTFVPSDPVRPLAIDSANRV